MKPEELASIIQQRAAAAPSSLRESAGRDAIALLMRWATAPKLDQRSVMHELLLCLSGMKQQQFDVRALEGIDDETMCRLDVALQLVSHLKQSLRG